MAGLMVVLILSMAGLVKWTDSFIDEEADWKTTIQSNLEMEKASLDSGMLKGESKRHAEENIEI